MREGEFERLVKIAVEEAEGGFVLVGTGSNSTYHTQKKTELAAELGASAALVVMPYYNKPGPAGQLAHMKAAARIMPIVPYDVSSRTAKPMDLNVIAELSGHPRVIGYKAATHEIYDQNRELLWVQSERVTQELASDTFRVWSGDDSRTLSLMQQGAYGVISVASNAAPGQLGDMIDNAAEGDYLIAEKLNQELSNFFVDLFMEPNPTPVKAAMNRRDADGHSGMCAGYSRLPMTTATDHTMKTMEKRLTELGII